MYIFQFATHSFAFFMTAIITIVGLFFLYWDDLARRFNGILEALGLAPESFPRQLIFRIDAVMSGPIENRQITEASITMEMATSFLKSIATALDTLIPFLNVSHMIDVALAKRDEVLEVARHSIEALEKGAQQLSPEEVYERRRDRAMDMADQAKARTIAMLIQKGFRSDPDALSTTKKRGRIGAGPSQATIAL